MTTNGNAEVRHRSRRGLHAGGWAALCAAIAGSVLLALPDQGPRLIAFSGAHGLTAQDALGAALLVGAWLAVVSVLMRRAGFRARLRAWPRRTAASFAAGIGVGLVVASAAGDFSGWWAIGAALLVGVQVAAFRAAARGGAAVGDDPRADDAAATRRQLPRKRRTASTRR